MTPPRCALIAGALAGCALWLAWRAARAFWWPR